MSTKDTEDDANGFETASKCGACGTMIAAVDEETHRTMMANHVIEEHEEEAHPQLLQECREVLGL